MRFPSLLRRPSRAAVGDPVDLGGGLVASPPAPLPFARQVLVRSFVLDAAEGTVLIYNAPGLKTMTSSPALAAGATWQVLNHGHEGMFGAPGIHAPVIVHQADAPEASASMPVAATFSGRGRLGPDLELIPTPGHTPGATAVLWHSRGLAVLFCGDTLWVDRGRWSTVLLPTSDRSAYVASLELIRELDFDVLAPWGALEGEALVHEVRSPRHRRAAVDAALAHLR